MSDGGPRNSGRSSGPRRSAGGSNSASSSGSRDASARRDPARGGTGRASGARDSGVRDSGARGSSAGRGSAPRGGAGRSAPRPDGSRFPGEEKRGGPRLEPKSPRKPEPAIDSDITGKELDRGIWTQLRTLSQENAEGVAGHLVMVARLMEENIVAAEAHAETAVRRAGRVPAAREALGLVAYRKGEWARALAEFRTVRRLSGSSHLLPLMVDCERALGRIERALELASSPEAASLDQSERVELAIVVSGIRRDLGEVAVATAGLEIPELASSARKPWAARLRYAYAEALLAGGDQAGARTWFARALDADPDGTTDASERLEELDGVTYLDLDDEPEDDVPVADHNSRGDD